MSTTFLPEIRYPHDTTSLPEAAEEFLMPCSVSQQRFWILDQLTAGNSALNIPIALQLQGPLKVEILQRALESVVQRHEVLRTSFIRADDEVSQVIASSAEVKLLRLNLSAYPPGKQQERLLAEMSAEAVRPLRLDTAPIFRATLVELNDNDHALLLTLHHIICDGWANGVIVREIGIFYEALLEQKPVVLPALPIQFADYALWQRDWMKTPDYAVQLAFWEKELSGGLPALDFPTDHPRKAGRMFPSYIESLLLPMNLTADVKRLCLELDVTIFMVLYAAFAVLLHRYTGQTRFIVGTTAANRTRPELENLVGQFSNPMMLNADLSGEPSFRELLYRVREKSLGAVSNQEVPFEMILERLESQSGGRDKPAIQALFLFQRAFMQPAQHGELAIRPLRSVSPGTTFEFTLGVVERAEGVRLQMEYNTELLENATICRMLQQFQMLLEAAVENPDALIGELPLLGLEERRRFWPDAAPATEVNPKSVIRFLDRQIQEHFRYAARPSGVDIEAPTGVRLAVLDRNLRLLPVGVPGEIYVGGPFSKETSAAGNSVSGPLDALVPVPLFCTGFIGCVRENGAIELQGAKTDFVQVGGFRTNLRQIKSLLLRHPAVAEAAATVFEQRGEAQLVAYVVLKPGTSAFEKELIAFLKGKVSDTALPARVVTVASMFKDPRGDVVTELLPKPQKVARPDGEKVPLGAILHQQLMEIWTDVLRIPSVGLDDNFFALGGSSLLALRMMMQVEKLCGRPLPLSILLTGATISNLAHHIAEANSESALPLITVQPNGKRQPLYFLHGDWAGGGFYCGRLAQQLGENQPFYALPPYRSGREETLTMEEMAAFHIAAMREHRPHGPYLIGGYCIGATVAVEMARQLVEQGEKVTRLLLVDAPLWGPRWLRWVWPVIDRLGRIANWGLQEKIYLFDRYGVSFGRWLKRSQHSKLMTLYRRLGIGGSAAATAKRTEGDLTEDDEILQSTDYAVYFLAYRLYKLRAIPVPATLYFPEATAPKRLAWVMKASSSAPVKFAVEILPGDHHTCITKHTAALATKMKSTLDSL